MRAYIIRRLLLVIPTLILVTLLIFSVVRFLPGDIIETMVMRQAEFMQMTSGEMELTIESVKRQLGLDQPIHIQYVRWLGIWPNREGAFSGIIQGDWGTSLFRKLPVRPMILARIPVSAELGIFSLLSGMLLALPVGIISAIRQDTILDYGTRTIAIAMISLPGFWVATMIIVYPSVYLNWMPELGYVSFLDNPLRNLGQFILPGFVMGMFTGGGIMRMTRTMMLEVLRQDYIRTAWAKGLRERSVIVRHAMKNAMIPVVTQIGLRIPTLIAGAVIIESIFGLPGMGRLFIEVLNMRDYPIISGINLLIASVVMFNNIVIDLTYAWLDPRVQYK